MIPIHFTLKKTKGFMSK